jgi:hypothetical protein
MACIRVRVVRRGILHPNCVDGFDDSESRSFGKVHVRVCVIVCGGAIAAVVRGRPVNPCVADSEAAFLLVVI